VATVLAVAYTNLDLQPGFGSGDVLIAKLVDTNLDGKPSKGDAIVMGKYPLHFAPPPWDFGEWGVKSATVTSVAVVEPTQVQVDTALGWHRWIGSGAYESYTDGHGTDFSIVSDHGGPGDGPDSLRIKPASVSRPAHDFAISRVQAPATNDFFIDTDIFD
jgi:hypothetical protein